MLGVIFSLVGSLLVAIYNAKENKRRNDENRKVQENLQNQQLEFQQKMLERKKEHSRKEEIRKSSVAYLSSLEKSKNILVEYIALVEEAEACNKFISNIVQSGGNLNAMLGPDPRQQLQVINERLTLLKSEWTDTLKEDERLLQELLLYFKLDEEDDLEAKLNKVLVSLRGFNWIFNTNLPTEMQRPVIDGNSFLQDIDEIRNEMRKFLN